MARKRIKREFTESMGRKLARCKIRSGAHTEDSAKSDHEMCIMEAVTFITGDQNFSDEPVCVSPALVYPLQSLNDSLTSDRQRAKLKKVIPTVMGTAPVYEDDYIEWDRDGNPITNRMLYTDHSLKSFQAVENKRHARLRKADAEYYDRFEDPEGDDYLSGPEIPLQEKFDLVKELADMGRW